ncbi:dehydrogenase [Agrobacterium vitis]|uniref:iron-containing alcohol dehydrogenase n=1 Tax=Agrobacterium vitis TaxID=373 RepID=UPI0015D67C41|nr:iron-containing alcohol dehydrogenase [Agrobacterium vitis]BCH59026.1 dehydrogenase [Agrobacterium vitis]
MKIFANWSYPTDIRVGRGRIEELGEACKSLGMRNPLLVTDRGLAALAITRVAQETLSDAGLDHALFADVDPNPTELNLEAGLAVFRDGGHDGVVAFGGGSGIDLGKCVAFMAGQTRPVWDFAAGTEGWRDANEAAILPVVTVPTTAGTGAEVGRTCVITNTVTHVKTAIFHPKMLPAIVICDPELTVGMPKSITAGTGMDAFAHCLEAYCSPVYHPLGQGIAIEGMRLVKEFLPKAYRDPVDLEARLNMMSAAVMGSIALQKGLGAIHALSHPIGAVYNTHHGTTNAVLMPMVVSFNRKAIERKIEKLAGYLEIQGGFDGFHDFLMVFREDLAIPHNLSELGVPGDRLDDLAAMAIRDASAASNPVKMTLENTTALLAECF